MADKLAISLDELEVRLTPAFRSNRVRKAAVFGSVSRGENTADSDVDLLVDMLPGASLMDLSGLLLDAQDALNRSVDVITYAGLKNSTPIFEHNVLRDAKVFYES